MTNTIQTDRLKKLLQPDVVIELGEMVSGPLDLLQLKERLDQWRSSQTGPATTSEPTVERRIQFKPETWEALNQLAERLGAQGACVTADQVAALLIESSLARMKNDARE